MVLGNEELTPGAHKALQNMREARKKADAMRKREQSLAFEHATSIIESHCAMVSIGMYDLGNVDPAAADDVQQCAEYLEWRSLLLRLESNPQHVSFLDETEAGTNER